VEEVSTSTLSILHKREKSRQSDAEEEVVGENESVKRDASNVNSAA